MHSLTAMTMNTWHAGTCVKDGLKKTARHILDIGPDILALQEVRKEESFQSLLQLLGPDWKGVRHSACMAIAAPHSIKETSASKDENSILGCEVTMDLASGQKLAVNVWSMHADYLKYGPYACADTSATEAHINYCEKGRIQDLQTLCRNAVFQENLKQADSKPLIVMGDLNAPSHLDWTKEAAPLHYNRAHAWPATLELENIGLTDSFREVYPDPVAQPGITWSTVEKFGCGFKSASEPQDRIDYIFYKSRLLKPSDVYTYAGNAVHTPTPNHENNDWPSDHYAVVGKFILKS